MGKIGKTIWSIQTEANNWNNDLYNSDTPVDCLRYAYENEIELDGINARIMLIDSEDQHEFLQWTGVQTIQEYYEGDVWQYVSRKERADLLEEARPVNALPGESGRCEGECIIDLKYGLAIKGEVVGRNVSEYCIRIDDKSEIYWPGK